MLEGHRMRQLFVVGEVVLCVYEEALQSFYCSVNITNDNNHVCRVSFYAADEQDLEKQFFNYLKTDDFQQSLRR